MTPDKLWEVLERYDRELAARGVYSCAELREHSQDG